MEQINNFKKVVFKKCFLDNRNVQTFVEERTNQLVEKGVGLPYFDIRSRSLSIQMNHKNQKFYQGKVVYFFPTF